MWRWAGLHVEMGGAACRDGRGYMWGGLRVWGAAHVGGYMFGGLHMWGYMFGGLHMWGVTYLGGYTCGGLQVWDVTNTSSCH